MTARSRHRGHGIKWVGHKWVFTDWSDTCLGMLPSVRQACCGHGHPEDAYFIFHDGVEMRGADAVRLQECWKHFRVSPHDVIEMYLRTLDVEETYRVCSVCIAAGVTLPDVLKVLDTFCRK